MTKNFSKSKQRTKQCKNRHDEKTTKTAKSAVRHPNIRPNFSTHSMSHNNYFKTLSIDVKDDKVIIPKPHYAKPS
ncbi:hypothetical protein IKG20_03385 [Candidatus Saccharibacteria bacterium]|nr:hypothetical protein [Candidatus Saccharibacteria bacterium]